MKKAFYEDDFENFDELRISKDEIKKIIEDAVAAEFRKQLIDYGFLIE
jgi:hypothetical protein